MNAPWSLAILAPLLLLGNGPVRGAAPATAAVALSSDGPCTFVGGVAMASDNATCQFLEYTLTADHVIYNHQAHLVRGVGHARLVGRGKTVQEEEITIRDPRL